ncbi:MAG: hypothetical protein P1V36_10450 [Planctomycetota bacterium]|nr:hypothetical protein [Planctomycetota bacterium]
MSAAATLAVVATDRLDAGALEWLRLCTGLVAAGGALTLVEVGKGAGLFSRARDLPEEAERQLEGLAAFEVVPRAVEAPALRELLVASQRVLRVASPARRGTPALVVIDGPWLMHVPDPALVLAFEEAGQLIRG